MNYKVFMVGLPDRQDRRKHIVAELLKHGFEYNTWSAIKMEDGAQGLVETMKHLLEYAIDHNIERILVIEDDAKFLVDNPKLVITACLSQLPDDFDCCYFGVTLLQNKPTLYSANLIQLTNGLATHCIMYSKQGMVKLLAAIKDSPGIQLDKIIRDKIMVPDGKCFASFPILATQIDSYSDIQKSEMKYARHIEDQFYEKTKYL